MTAPDEPSSRAASSTTSWSSSAGSWMVIIRRAISRSARSASAVRSRAPCEVARRSTRRALASGDRGLAGQRVEQPERVLAERVAVAVAGLEHADEAVLADHRAP